MNNRQIKNLRHLATMLDRKHGGFDMKLFAAGEIEGMREELKPNRIAESCGTVCCALGEGARLGIGDPKNYLTWADYALTVFGIRASSASPEWNWVFGGKWSRVDNSPRGASLRIFWMIEKGIPENWYDMMTGNAPLCYRQRRQEGQEGQDEIDADPTGPAADAAGEKQDIEAATPPPAPAPAPSAPAAAAE